ncbi:MAG TPA: GDP-L-fucose synthase [Actinomycetota bacterium]|nr:GDP-L-fucose synthase [Actinomycetota bacterium]
MEERIAVTGGHGFLGSAVRAELKRKGYEDVIAPRSAEYDLRLPGAVASFIKETDPSVIIHLAATVGGIGANMAHPGKFFYDNAVMGIHLMEQARLSGVEKFVTAGSVCAYPKHAPIPFREEDLWNGYPEETNAPYGLAKKMLLVQGQAYRREYDFNAIYLIPVNLYGPGDNFDPATSHVIPALIKKFEEAREAGHPTVEAWGTGLASREFLYVEDAASAIVKAVATYDGDDPINIGSSEEITIKDLTELIGKLTGFEGTITWDESKPDGQPRRKLDISRAENLLGFKPTVPLEEGLRRTVDWYRNQKPG